jgi:hypothetical protein
MIITNQIKSGNILKDIIKNIKFSRMVKYISVILQLNIKLVINKSIFSDINNVHYYI